MTMNPSDERPRTSLHACSYCRGEGRIGVLDCPACGGKGDIMVVEPAEICPCCQGWGVLVCCRCAECEGTGWKNIRR